MRRSVGVARVSNKSNEAFRTKAETMEKDSIEHVRQSVTLFRQHLEDFAVKHRAKIAGDPEFRTAFAGMCASIGIDPLASQKGFWAQVLGIGDFYFELGVQIISVAIASRPVNGGVMSLDDVMIHLNKIRRARGVRAAPPASIQDVRQAIDKVAILGNGFRLCRIGDSQDYLVSVPLELSSDQTRVLELAKSEGGHLTCDQLKALARWDAARSERALADLANSGLAWMDHVDNSFWFPSLWSSSRGSGGGGSS